ncbi:MAG TPA: ATP-binding protein [Candidatus Deferrimicrobiaceae bacterium]
MPAAGPVINPDIDYILFFKGVSFAFLAMVCLIIRQEGDRRLPWEFLAGFGFLHAIKDLLSLATLLHADIPSFPGFVTALRGAYLLSLLEFGREGLRRRGVRVPPRQAHLLVLMGAMAYGYWGGRPFLDNRVHLAIGIPAALAVAAALFPLGPAFPGKLMLRFASAGFVAYALLLPASGGAASSLIDRHMLSFGGAIIPIGMVQGGVVVLTATMLWIAFQRVHAGIRSATGRRYGMLFSTGFLCLYGLIVVAGYFVTTYLGNSERRYLDSEIRSHLTTMNHLMRKTVPDAESEALIRARKDDPLRPAWGILDASGCTVFPPPPRHHRPPPPGRPPPGQPPPDFPKPLPGHEAWFKPDFREKAGELLPFRPNGGGEYVLFGHVWRAGLMPTGIAGRDLLVLQPAERIWRQRAIGIGITFGIFLLTFAVYDATRRLSFVQMRAIVSEKRFGSLFERVPEAAFLIEESSWRIIEGNPNAVALLGYERSEFPSLRLTDLLNVKDHVIVESFLSTFSEGAAINRELTFLRKDGLQVPVEVVGGRLRHGQGDAVLLLARDITDRISWEANLRTVWESAIESSRMKSEFLANMSHEIRTPMNGVLGMLDLVLDTYLTQTQREYLEMSRASAENLMSLINDVLDISRIEAGRMELETVPFSVDELLQSALGPLYSTAKGKGIRMCLEVGKSVPPRVCGDPVRLRQVLMNLAGNAVKFTENGSVTVSVETAGSPGAGMPLRFRVADTGIGIPKDRQEAIFQAFTQVDSSITRKFGGSGLGLNIAFRLVRLMGGELAVESVEGEGSVFRFDLEMASAEGEAPGARPRPLDGSGDSRGGRDLKVLVVEDNAINRELARIMLEGEGWGVKLASAGPEAIAHFSRESFDLVLMDIQMPGMDGIEVTRRIKSVDAGRGRHTPVVALTAHALAGDKDRFLASGLDGYVAKPVCRVALVEEIRRLVFKRPEGAIANSESYEGRI